MATKLNRLGATACRWGERGAACLQARPLLWSFLLAAAVSALSAGVLAPSLYMNDDVSMAATVDGSRSGRPQAHIVHTNVAVGLVLAWLYRAAGTVPWYGIYLFAVQFLAMTAILYVVLADRRPTPGPRLLAAAAWLGVFGLWMGTQITFTQVAFLIGSAGVLLYLARASSAQTRWWVVTVAGVMFGASYLIRPSSCLALVVLSLPSVLFAVRRIPWHRQALFGAVAAGIVLFGWVFNTAFYAGKTDWHQYFAFNDARVSLESSDAARRTVDEEILDVVGWSENDLLMYQKWFFADEEVYSAQNLQQLADSAGNDLLSPGDALRALRRQVDLPAASLGLASIAALLGATWVRGGRLTVRWAVVNTVWFGGVAATLLFTLKLPSRVALPMLSFLVLLLLTAPQAVAPDADSRRRQRGSTVARRLSALVLVAALVAGLVDAAIGAGQRRAADRSFDQLLTDFEELDPEGTFVSLGAALGTGRRSPWHAPVIPSPPLISLGWEQRSPMYYAQLVALSVDDLYLAIGSRQDIYFPLRAGSDADALYLTYLEEHYGFSALFRPRVDLDSHIVFDLAVAYELDDPAGVVVEHRLDGTEVRHRLAPATIVGGARLRAVQTRVQVTGWAGDLVSTGPVDHIVVFDGGRAIAIVLPDREPPTPKALDRAARLGFTEDDHLGFRLVVDAAAAEGLRIYALSDGRAAELTP